jgi:alanine racemase
VKTKTQARPQHEPSGAIYAGSGCRHFIALVRGEFVHVRRLKSGQEDVYGQRWATLDDAEAALAHYAYVGGYHRIREK